MKKCDVLALMQTLDQLFKLLSITITINHNHLLVLSLNSLLMNVHHA